MEAGTTGSPVLVPDLHNGAEAAQWPIFAAAVAEQTSVGAVRATAAVEDNGAVYLGVLDQYRVYPGGLSDL